MIQVEELKQAIESELNGNLNTIAFNKHFKIHSNVGEFVELLKKENGINIQEINGVIKANNGQYIPVKGVNNLFATLSLEFAIQEDFIDQLLLILTSWEETLNGAVYTYGDWAYLIQPTTPQVGSAKNTCALGSTIPVNIVLSVQMIKNGLIANNVVYTLDGEEINATNRSLSSNRTISTQAYANEFETKSAIDYSTKTFAMTIPFGFTPLCKKLGNDILKEQRNTYTLTRHDGFCDDISWQVILTDGVIMEENGKIVAMQLTFHRADV